MKKVLFYCLMLGLLTSLPVLANNYWTSNTQSPTNGITTFPLKGESLGNEILQRDTVPSVIMAVATLSKGCGSYSIVNTKVLKYPANDSWKEEWTVNACSVNYNVPITFMLDATGATYRVHREEIYRTY